MHDDQHGTAIVVLAALRNAATVTGRDARPTCGWSSPAPGAAGVACTKILLEAGIGDIAVADSQGVLHAGRDDLTPIKQWLVDNTNRAGFAGTHGRRAGGRRRLPRAVGRLGARVGDRLDGAGLHRLLAGQPDPRGRPRDGARSTPPSSPPAAATCPTRSTTCSPSPASSGAPSTPARHSITEEMKLAAAAAIADVVGDELRPDYVVPSPLDRRVAPAVAEAVAACAREQGVTALSQGAVESAQAEYPVTIGSTASARPGVEVEEDRAATRNSGASTAFSTTSRCASAAAPAGNGGTPRAPAPGCRPW